LPHHLPNSFHGFNKWRLVLILFLIGYIAILLIDIDYHSIQWDEIPHLYGGLLLSDGQFQEYIETEAFYPPVFDIITGVFFKILGPSIFSARLVALIFSVLTVWVVFETAYKMYSPKAALVASILLASMPGFIWLSRTALLESMLMFFFMLSQLLFYSWLNTNKIKMLIFAAITLGIGFLVKYQAVVNAIIFLFVLLFLSKKRIQNKICEILLIAMIMVVIALPWVVFTYEQLSSEILETWFYSLQMGSESRLAYSTRFPLPIFYFLEIFRPYSYIHPISLFIYIFSLIGLGLWLMRRNQIDKFLVIGFFVTYTFFTIITSKDWRYISIIFPILAISGSEFISWLYDRVKNGLDAPIVDVSRKRFYKILTTVFILLVCSSIIYSIWDSYVWLESEHFNYPVREACQYVAENSIVDETAVAFFPTNYFNIGIMRFFMEIYDSGQRRLLQYPENAVDVFRPLPNDERFFLSLNILMKRFEVMNVKYLLLIEWETKYYFEEFYDSSDVLENLNATGHFILETEIGSYPHRMFIIRFL
jgi:hypothetical protein